MNKLKDFFDACPFPAEPLSQEDSDFFIRLRLNKDISEPVTYAEFLAHPSNSPKDKIPQALMLLWGRSLRLGEHFRMSISANLFLSFFIRKPEDAALYFGYVAHCAKKKETRDITLEFLSVITFPFGVFSQEELDQMWELQKNEGSPDGNLLDDANEWRVYLFGDAADGKVLLRYSDEDERPMSPEEVAAIGEPKEPKAIDGRMFFWLGAAYVSCSLEDFEKISAQ